MTMEVVSELATRQQELSLTYIAVLLSLQGHVHMTISLPFNNAVAVKMSCERLILLIRSIPRAGHGRWTVAHNAGRGTHSTYLPIWI
jgi:hypothetical protein